MRDIRRGVILDVRPYVSEGSRDDSLVVGGTLHRVRLAGARLSVSEHAAIESVQYRRDQGTYLQ